MQQKEMLSALMDGENVDANLAKEIVNNAKLQQSWESFHLIRSVIRNENDVLLGTDFTTKLSAALENEELEPAPLVAQPTPEEVAKLPFMAKLKGLFSPILQVGVAAAVCLVAVVGVQTYNTSNGNGRNVDSPVLQTLPLTNSAQEVSYNVPNKDVTDGEQLEQKNKRIGAMLQDYELQRRVYADSTQNSDK